MEVSMGQAHLTTKKVIQLLEVTDIMHVRGDIEITTNEK